MTSRAGQFSAHLVVLAAMAGMVRSAMAQSFTLVGFPTPTVGEGTGRAYALSADGQHVAGHSTGTGGTRGFRWTAGAGRDDFGLSLSQSTYGFGISGDGNTVVGATPSGQYHAYRWTASGGFQSLGTLPGYINSEARDASQDGSVIVGTLSNAEGSVPQAFRWTQAGGMQGLGVGTMAHAISGDGNVIVGEIGNTPLAFSWTQATGLQFLSPLTGTGGSYAFATNNSGNVIVGRSGPNLRTTMWVNGSPVELLSSIPNLNVMTPYGVSDDGSVVAGQMSAGFAAVWTPATRTMRLDEYLTANGVTVPSGVTLTTCTAISADGRTFAGWTSGSQGIQGFVATIPAPCPADLDNDGSLINGGARDRAVTIDDLLYLLSAFESGNLAADLDNGSNTGTRDNAVTIDDLLFFLAHFESGC